MRGRDRTVQVKLKTKRLKVAAFFIVILIPAILIGGVMLGDRNYAITSFIIVILAMLPFFFMFENRRPQARELVPIAVMAAIGAIGRLAFTALPQFKPIVAIVIITALSFGPEAGFLTGAVSMLVSNFFFGQGPWTPWQMFCCGIIGFIAGLLRKKGMLKGKVSICVFGFLSGYIYGMIVDVWTVAEFASPLTFQSVLAIYISGFAFNTILAVATAIFLLFLEKPMTKKLDRIKIKFGLEENT